MKKTRTIIHPARIIKKPVAIPQIVSLRKKAIQATKILRSIYHSPQHNNKQDPLDEIVFIILSQMTTYRSFERVFDRLKKIAPTWEMVRRMQLKRLKRLIKDAGLSNQKAPRIRAVLNRLRNDFGRVTLEPLRQMKTSDAEAYLVSLPGVQMKSAKCVLMYSLKRKVLPIDTHVLRVARRLGLLDDLVISEKAHRRLEAIVEPSFRYAFHVNSVSHGRSICLTANPRCPLCRLKRLCDYYKK